MHLIVCLDDRNGMLYNKRRQSKDRVLRNELLSRCEQQRLWMNSYSAEQFQMLPETVRVDDDFLDKAEEYDFCFVENLDVSPYVDRVRSLTVYRWNRKYPADRYFPLDIVAAGMRIVNSRNFTGSSHERITEEVYGW